MEMRLLNPSETEMTVYDIDGYVDSNIDHQNQTVPRIYDLAQPSTPNKPLPSDGISFQSYLLTTDGKPVRVCNKQAPGIAARVTVSGSNFILGAQDSDFTIARFADAVGNQYMNAGFSIMDYGTYVFNTRDDIWAASADLVTPATISVAIEFYYAEVRG